MRKPWWWTAPFAAYRRVGLRGQAARRLPRGPGCRNARAVPLRPRRPRALRGLRREPARADQLGARFSGRRVPAGPRLRPDPGRSGPREGRASPPHRALLRGAGRGCGRRRDPRRGPRHRAGTPARALGRERGRVSAALTSKFGRTARTPDKPGPGPVPDALLRTLRPVVRRRVEGIAAREHASTLLGEGTELAHVGPYEPGDGGRRRTTIPPRAGRVGAIGLVEAARRDPEDAEVGRTSVGDALRHLARLARRRGLVVVVSDFRGPMDWRRPLVALAGRHEVLAVEVRDPREDELPDVGDLLLEDPETGQQLRVDTGSRRLREHFAEAAAAERREVAGEIARSGAGHVVLSTRGDWLRELAFYLGGRTLRWGGV